MSLGLFFILIGLLFLFVEVFTVTFFFLPVGITFFITGIFAFFLPPFYLIFIFLLSAILCFYGSRQVKQKLLKGKMNLDQTSKDTEISLVGQKGTVYREGDDFKVKVFSDSWIIIPDDHNPLQIGDKVKIVAVHGNRVSVSLESVSSNHQNS